MALSSRAEFFFVNFNTNKNNLQIYNILLGTFYELVPIYGTLGKKKSSELNFQ